MTVTVSLHISDKRGKIKTISITELRYVPLQHFQILRRNTHQAMNPLHPLKFWLKKKKTKPVLFLPNEVRENKKKKAMLRHKI